MKKNKKTNQQIIKALLIDKIIQDNKNCIICSEMPFLYGKRWADLVVLNKNTIVAYEIKSELDSLKRLPDQIEDYIKTFDKVYVVVSKKFQDTVLSNKFNRQWSTFKNIGLWIVDNNNIVKKRKAVQRRRLKKSNLSYFLWKKDLQKYLKQDKSVQELRTSLINKSNLEDIKKIAISCLKDRYQKRFDVFLHDRYNKTHIDDLRLLTSSNLQI